MDCKKLKLVVAIGCAVGLVSGSFGQTTKYKLPNGHFNLRQAFIDSETKGGKASQAAVDAFFAHGPSVIVDVFDYLELKADQYPKYSTMIAKFATGFGEKGKPYLLSAALKGKKLTRHVATKLLATIAYNNVEHIPSIAKSIPDAEKHDPWIHGDDVRETMLKASVDPVLEVRINCVEFFTNLDDADGEEPALLLLRNKKLDRKVRIQALWSLTVLNRSEPEILINAFKDMVGSYPKGLLLADSELGFAVAKGLLNPDLYRNETLIDRTCDALGMIGKFQGQESVDIIWGYISSTNGEIRSNAAMALGMAGGAKILPELIELSQSDDEQVKPGAIIGMGLTKAPAAYELLCKLVAKKDQLSDVAIFGLRNLGDKRAIKFLQPYTHSKIGAIRKEAVDTIKALKAS